MSIFYLPDVRSEPPQAERLVLPNCCLLVCKTFGTYGNFLNFSHLAFDTRSVRYSVIVPIICISFHFSSDKNEVRLKYLLLFFFFFFFCLLGLYLRHMEVPGLGAESAYATATATPDLSRICDLHHSSQQCRIRNSLIEARIEPMSSWILV